MRHHTIASYSKNNSIKLPPNMESLKLPVDLLWEGKTEPNSPPVQELFPFAEDTLIENCLEDDENIANELLITEDDLKLKLGLDDSIELLSEDDMVLEIYDLKEEHWNTEKFQTPVNDLVDDYLIGSSITQTNPITKVYLPNSYDFINGGIETYTTNTTTCFENAILTQLTPPHSPPLENINIINKERNITSPTTINLNTIIQVEEQELVIPQQQQQQHQQSQQIAVENIWPSVNINNDINKCIPQPTTNTPLDIQREMQIVDEIVNTRVKELIDWHELETISNSSNISSPATSIQANESIVDEDWFPTSATSYTSSSCASPACSNLDESQDHQHQQQQPILNTTTISNKKRTRPYGRAIEDRKLRKKEQNKNAATRYRQKKKLEMEHVLTEEAQLIERNEELKRQLAARKSEAKYLKTLIREFYAKQQHQQKQN